MKAFVIAVAAACTCAGADVIYDNTASWSGAITSSWFAQAQIFPVPAGNTTLKSWTSFFDSPMTGMQIDFMITDVVGGVPGGTVHYLASPIVPAGGAVTVDNINLSLDPNTMYAAVWDFRGYAGSSIFYTLNDEVPGNGAWNNGNWENFDALDQLLIAHFVPAPGSLLAIGGAAVLLPRRRRS